MGPRLFDHLLNRCARHAIFGIILCLPALNAYAAPVTPHGGWVFVPGAQDLIQAGEWGCTTGVAIARYVSITAPGTAITLPVTNTTGPVLMLQGDFSVLATLSDPGTAGAYLTLVGTLATGSQVWQGLKRLDVGISGRPS